MKNIEILRARAEEIEAEFRSIDSEAGERSLNDEEQVRWDELDAELKQVREDIAEGEAEAARAARVAESRAKWGSLQVGVSRQDPFENLDVVARMSDDDPALIDRALSAVEKTEYRRLAYAVSDEARENATRMIERVPGVARMAMATGSPEYMAAFRNWVKSLGAPVYSAEEAAAVRASMSLTSANGGYALPFLLDPTLIHTGTATKNPIRQIARVESGTSDKWNGVTVSNVTTAWTAEGVAFTDGSPTTGGVTVDAAKLTAYVTGSFEIFQDSNLLAQLPGLIGESIDYAESAAFISGSGSGAPKGVITAVSGTAGSLVTVTTRGSFTSASIADTIALVNALAVRYEDTATWVLNKAIYRTIEQQMVGTGAVKAVEMTNGKELF
ncbi:MAG: phage major capsid protein, partial [Actinobacteria bacterium]|nr:phage major capsid protein [Actinomycetota bacterium]